MVTETEQDEVLAEELAGRIDAGMLESAAEDGSALQALLQTYTRLQSVVEEPDPAFARLLQRSLRRKAEKVPRGLAARLARWFSWTRQHWQPVLSGVTILMLVVVLAVQFLPVHADRMTGLTYVQAGNPVNTSAGNFTYAPALTHAHYSVTGLPSEVIDSRGNVTRYEYDALGRVTRVVDPAGETWGYTYDAAGNMVSTTNANGYASTYRYDALGRLVSVTGPLGQTTTYAYENPWVPGDRMVAQRAHLTLVAQDPQYSLVRLQEIITSRQGILVRAEMGQTSASPLSTFVSLQVPAEVFGETLAQIKALAINVVGERVTNEDVTASYVDLDARLKNLELTETELQALLQAAQERGDSAEDILNIHKTLSDIRGQIEQLQAQKRLLEESVALAQIDVALIPLEIAPGFRPLQVLNDAWMLFLRVLETIVTGLIYALLFALLVLPVVGVVVLLWRARRRARHHED